MDVKLTELILWIGYYTSQSLESSESPKLSYVYILLRNLMDNSFHLFYKQNLLVLLIRKEQLNLFTHFMQI